MSLVGTTELSVILRILTAIELFENAHFYQSHPRFTEAMELGCTFGRVTIFTLSLREPGMDEFERSGSRISAIQSEAIGGCEFRKWSSLQHIMALSTVISRNIFTVYPNCAKAIRPLLHGVIKPRATVPEMMNLEDPFYILWSRDANLDNRPNAIYVPNHFVPLFRREQGVDHPKGAVGPSEKEALPTKKKGKRPLSLADFWFPSNAKKEAGKRIKMEHKREKNDRRKEESKRKTENETDDKMKLENERRLDDKKKMNDEKKMGDERTIEDEKKIKDERITNDERKAKDNSKTSNDKKVENEVKETTEHPTIGMKSNVRKFKLSWKQEFTWLKYEPEKNLMYCIYCQEAGAEIAGQTDLVTGSCSFKKETLTIHSNSTRHRRARDHVLNKQREPSQGPLSKAFQKVQQKNDKEAQREMSVKFNTAYFLAKEELPFTKYAGLIQLQKKNGLEVGPTYANDTKCAEMTQIIAKLLADDLSQKLREAHFFSLLIDGASDVAGIENETIHCRIIQNGRVVSHLVGHKSVEHADADGKD